MQNDLIRNAEEGESTTISESVGKLTQNVSMDLPYKHLHTSIHTILK